MAEHTPRALADAEMDRRRFIGTVAGGMAAALPLAAGAGVLAQQAAETAAPKPPKNLIFIVADTFRADHLGCYGSESVKTPNLDRLAQEGLLFTNAYADGLPTIPCRRVYHTGKSIIPMRVHGGWIPLQPGRKTLAQVLGGQGFRTAFIADTYHYFKPGMNFHQGFRSWQWIRGQETDPWQSGPQDKFDPKKHMPEHLWNQGYDRNMRQYLMNTQDRESEQDYFCARSFRAGLQWLERNADADRLLLWIDTFDPHEPWDAPRRFQEMYHGNYPCERFLFGYGVRNKDIRPEDLPAIRGLYAAEASFVDDRVGKFVDGVRELGLLDNTAIVFSTDHGTHLGEEGCVQKTAALLNSCVARLPLIIRHPDRSLAGRRVDALIGGADYMPTFLDLLGIEHELELDGKSFWGVATGDAAAIHDAVITEYAQFASVHTNEWHYFQNTKAEDSLTVASIDKQAEAVKSTARGAPHLYDLPSDPKEETNVVLDHKGVVAEMQERLRERYEA
jgi:arylsulfatase A-like enzyme